MNDARIAEGHRIAERASQKTTPAIIVLVIIGSVRDLSFDNILTVLIVGIFFGVIAYGVGFFVGYVGAEADTGLTATERTPADPYEIAGKELLNRKVDVGIWARAVAEGGTDNEINARYINWRVALLDAEQPATASAEKNDTFGFRLGQRLGTWLNG